MRFPLNVLQEVCFSKQDLVGSDWRRWRLMHIDETMKSSLHIRPLHVIEACWYICRTELSCSEVLKFFGGGASVLHLISMGL